MAHFPVNHPHRGLFRGIALVTGLTILLFGLIGVISASDRVFGLPASDAIAWSSLLLGVLIIAGTWLPGVTHNALMTLGALLWIAGLLMLALQRTDLDGLGGSVSTCIVAFIAGTLLFWSGSYLKTGSHEQEVAQEAFRHSSRGVAFPAVEEHELALHPQVPHRGEVDDD